MSVSKSLMNKIRPAAEAKRRKRNRSPDVIEATGEASVAYSEGYSAGRRDAARPFSGTRAKRATGRIWAF
jgi:hypothetical protein